ncbi:hypothetical protein [Campylobacter concisus]
MENSLNFSDEIKEATGLINSAGAWGANEFLVFMVIFGFVVFVVIFWLLNKTANKNSEILVDISVRSNEAINNNTAATRELVETLRTENGANRQKLNEIHDDVKEIKQNVRRRRPIKNNKFSEHIGDE